MITLGELTALARSQIEAQRDVEAAEAALEEAKKRLVRLREEALPMAMAELGLQEFKLDTGEKVSVKQDVYASIPVANRDQAFDWLEGHGFGGLVKTELSLEFGKGELERAKAVAKRMQDELGLAPDVERNVHSQTLKAFLREQLAAANPELPLDLFGARPVWVATIKK